MPDSHLHILLVLAQGDAHGYRIMGQVEHLTRGTYRLRPGVLYSALGRLVDQGLIVESAGRPAAELDDQRRRYYRITGAGRQALGTEIERLAHLVDLARTIEPRLALS